MFNPKFRLGEKVVVGDGLITGTISDIIYNSNGFQYMLAEYPDIFNENELTSLEEKEDIVTIDLGDNDDEDSGIERFDIVRVKGTDAIFVVRKVEGKNAFIINVRNGNEIMFPLDKLEKVTSIDKIEETINPEMIDIINEKLSFEIDDLVKVKGYKSIFTIVDHNEDKTEFKVKQYLLEEITDEIIAFPEDMEIADIEEVEAYENQSFIMSEFKPFDQLLPEVNNHLDTKEKQSEKHILSKLEHNRKIVSKLKEWQDWFFEAYSFTKDEKYIRRIKRVQGWINKIPTRAYQIK